MRSPERWIGVDVGGTKLLAVTVDEQLRLLGTTKVETRADEGPEDVIGRIVDLVRTHVVGRNEASAIRGIGLGVAGLVEHEQGVVQSSVILPGWKDVALAKQLGDLFEVAVYVDNDATAAGYGEYQALGSPPGLHMVLLTLGTGIGGAIVLDGHLYRGSTNMSAEFGNTTIDHQGPACISGNRGSLNSLASGRTLSARAEALADRHPDSTLAKLPRPIRCQDLAGLYPETELVCGLVDETGQRIGVAVANLVQVFNPDRVALMGGLCGFGERFLEGIRHEVRERCFSVPAEHASIELTVHGEKTGAIGAAALCRDREAAR